ncbi:unnamed protein product, partial [Dicrocoelium dendriticum]
IAASGSNETYLTYLARKPRHLRPDAYFTLISFGFIIMLRDIDSLYSTAGHPIDFIKDISKKMQVPHRISFGPVELERPSSSSTNPESDMRVPDHILITEPIEMKDAPAPPELTADLDLVPIDRRLSLPPIPSTLALDEISYPDLDRLLMEREQRPSSSPIHPLPEYAVIKAESSVFAYSKLTHFFELRCYSPLYSQIPYGVFIHSFQSLYTHDSRDVLVRMYGMMISDQYPAVALQYGYLTPL